MKICKQTSRLGCSKRWLVFVIRWLNLVIQRKNGVNVVTLQTVTWAV